MEHRMKLHEDKNLFRQAVRYTADQMKIQAIYVEKDYWVTFVLKTIFADAIGAETVFKGGTALSKCYRIIDRFSEDIDLVVLHRERESNSQLTKKIRTISSVVSSVLPEIEIEGITHKMGMNRKTAHTYHKEFTGIYGQIRDAVVVEATWFGYFEPFTKRLVNSFVGEMMANSGQQKIAEEYEMQPFEIKVLEPIRTICEKIMSLVRFSYGENPVGNLRQKIRHIYDLHQLLQQKEFNDFFESNAFDEMLLKVAADDIVSFRNNNQWLVHHPIESLIFSKPEEIWIDLGQTYQTDFKNLVYGVFPSEEFILTTLKKIKERLVSIKWIVKVEDIT
jgi:Nucleotidyl transferase AbiEii toxin, Type IV TA system